MIGKLPTEEEIEYFRRELLMFDDPKAVFDFEDPAEEYFDRVPYMLETILAQHAEIKRLKSAS